MSSNNSGGAKRRAVVLAPSFSTDMNANRPLSVACVLSRFADVEVVTTDFDHWTKKKRKKSQFAPIDKIVYLETLPYYDNVSITRLLSHVLFAVSAGLYFFRRRKQFEIVYVTLPFNTLAWIALRSARTKWKIVDVMDIWPDVLPFKKWHVALLRPLFSFWRSFFNQAAASADVMMAVSDSFFEETLKFVAPGCRSRRFYLGEVDLLCDVPKSDTLTVAYSGNLGRLYDFETLLDIMTDAERGSVQLFIVGDGDRRDWLLTELQQRGISYKYFGSVYDPAKLGDILCRAHVGFNGFVNTSAAFSTKASTYFAAGLPLLNSMEGDLKRLVAEHELGFNYSGGDRNSLKRCFLQLDEHNLIRMSRNCRRFFEAELDRTKVRENLYSFLSGCLGGPGCGTAPFSAEEVVGQNSQRRH